MLSVGWVMPQVGEVSYVEVIRLCTFVGMILCIPLHRKFLGGLPSPCRGDLFSPRLGRRRHVMQSFGAACNF